MKKVYTEPDLELINFRFSRMMGDDPGDDVYIGVSDPQIPTRVIDEGV